jgi:hypothetical protein
MSKKYRQKKALRQLFASQNSAKKTVAHRTQAHMPPSILFIINHVYGPVLWRAGGRGKLSPVDNETNKTAATKQQLKIT